MNAKKFQNKKILIGITGGIAAYKACALVSRLKKEGGDVHVMMTENAAHFVDPMTFETLSGNRCVTDTFDRNHQFNVEHVALATDADLFLIAPATANTIAKLACGLADNMLTTTFLAADCPKMVAPAMNTGMYENPVTQRNMNTLREFGIQVIEPDEGYLACGVTGSGRMPEAEELYTYVERELLREKDLAGKRILVTAGATRESMDPVRFITNHSSGKMGYAIAKECMLRGADVVVVRAHTTADAPAFCHYIDAVSAADMYREVMRRSMAADAVFMAAAVSDYTPKDVAEQKMKKSDEDLSLELKRTVDILARLGETKREGQFICGFSMETQNLVENSARKLVKKHADMIVANNLMEQGAGFGTDTNRVTLITKHGAERLELMSKEEVAREIVDRAREALVSSN